jgi:hypothetical protein
MRLLLAKARGAKVKAQIPQQLLLHHLQVMMTPLH